MHSMRAAALCIVLGISVFAAGCAGHSGATPPVLPVAGTTASNAIGAPTSAGGTRTADITPTVGLVGKITAVTVGKFEVQGGSHIGYIWIYTYPYTQWSYNGLTLKAGYYATIYGTGSLSKYVSATSVSLSTTG